MKVVVFPVLALLALSPTIPPPESPMVKAAQEFIAALSPEQRAKALFALESPERKNWAYVPADRKGVAYFEMNAEQRLKAQALLRASISEKGMARVDEIRQHELILRQMENNNLSRDPDRYWFVFFGNPDAELPWVWRFEGHHTSLTFGSKGDTVVSSTPQFLGSNPAEVRSEGRHKGERILAKEQDVAFELVLTLTPSQLKEAVVSKTAPTDIITASSRKAGIEGRVGLRYHDLTPAQQKLVRDLLTVYCEVQRPEEQKRRLDKLKKEGYDDLVFAWMGPIARDGRHYYRIQGQTFVIEYDNTQDDGNHIHTVWRDFDGDFGDDLLKEHYDHDHH